MEVKDETETDPSGINIENVSENGTVVEDEYDIDKDEIENYTESGGEENNSKTLSLVASELEKTRPPVFGHVAISHSENVQFGNNTYFNGPVTIKQVIQTKSGVDNPSFEPQNEIIQNKVYQNGISKCDDSSSKPFAFKCWHIIILVTFGLSVIVGAVSSIVFNTIQESVNGNYSLVDEGFYNSGNSSTSPSAMVVVSFCLISLTILIFLTKFLMSHLLTKWKPGGNVTQDNLSKSNADSMTYYIKGNPLIIAPFHLRIVGRSDWLAQPETGALDKIKQPVPWVIITHTATESCSNQSECVLRVRVIQDFHIESRGWYDIGYNFLVGGDGSAYYGRGWDYVGAHTKGYNIYSIAIAFIGTFTTEDPPRQQLDACKKLIKMGVAMGKLSKDYKLLAHRQLMSTTSPGDKLFNIIKQWPHFVHNASDIEDMFSNL